MIWYNGDMILYKTKLRVYGYKMVKIMPMPSDGVSDFLQSFMS